MSNCQHRIAVTKDGTFQVTVKNYIRSAKCEKCGVELLPCEIKELIGNYQEETNEK